MIKHAAACCLASFLSLAAAADAGGGAVIAEHKNRRWGNSSTVVALDGGMTDRVYQAGSIGKYVCTLTALRLENQGKLSLDQTLDELLPGFDSARAGEVTLRDLLANRSGFKEGVVAALREDPALPNASIPALEAANRFAAAPGADAPGEAFDYVNSNWIIVQAVLERASGMPLTEAVTRYVLRPAKAKTAFFFIGDLPAEDGPQVSGSSLPLPDFISCAGALAARPQDLIAISRYPFRSRHFDEDDRRELMTLTTEEEDYTLGGRFEGVTDRNGEYRRISWQSGNNGPWSAQVIYDHEQDVAFAVVAADTDLEPVLARRAAWLKEHGLTWDEAED